MNASIIHFDSVYKYGQFKDFKIEFENLRTQSEIEIKKKDILTIDIR